MSKGTSSFAPGKSLMGFALLLVLSGLLFTVAACENLTTGTSATIGTVAEVATTTTTATPISIPATITETTAAEEPTPTPHTEDTAAATTITSSPIAMSPAMTMVHAGLWTRYEETDSHLVWQGEWHHALSDEASGGYAMQTDAHDAAVTIHFSGTSIAVIALKAQAGGKAWFILDGGVPVEVSYHIDTTPPLQQMIWSSGTLGSGYHVLRIIHDTGTGYMYLDAVDVIGTLVV
jgi:hypothetical protein